MSLSAQSWDSPHSPTGEIIISAQMEVWAEIFLCDISEKIEPLAGQHGGVTRTPPRYSNDSIYVKVRIELTCEIICISEKKLIFASENGSMQHEVLSSYLSG